MNPNRLLPLLLLALLPLAGCESATALPTTRLSSTLSPTTAPAPLVHSLEQSIGYLASDSLEGRGVGTEGLNLAASYIAGNFHAIGLQPAPGLDGYFQPFEITTINGTGPKSSLVLGDKTYQPDKDYIPLSLSAEKGFPASPVVFVGYGITSKDPAYDDYADVDVKGKVAVALRLEPVDEKNTSRFKKGPGWSRNAEFESKAKVAADHGAIALIVVTPPGKLGGDTLATNATVFGGIPAKIPVIQIKQSVADEWLKQADIKDLATLIHDINTDFKPNSMVLEKLELSGNADLLKKVNPVKNVVGVLPGAGPHADQYIVVGAHYDHLGRGGWGSRSPLSHEIHHGADDNASGTAAVIELARKLAADGPHDRSILFMTFTGEEEGLLGSEYFVNHSPIPLRQMAAMVNLDMVGRVREGVLSIGGTGTSLTLEKVVNEASAGLPLTLKTAWKNGFAPSDNTSFLLKKIPTLFFFSGLHEDYHRPTDTADKVNYIGEAAVVELAYRCLTQLTKADKIDFIATATTNPSMTGASPSNGAALGVVPDYGSDQSITGVKISGTSPASPADKAGLKEGDIITQLGQTKITSLYDLSDAINAAHPGDKLKLTYKRDNKEITVEVTLSARRSMD